MDKTNVDRGSNKKVLALINKIEPLAATETMYSTPKRNQNYTSLWAPDIHFQADKDADFSHQETKQPENVKPKSESEGKRNPLEDRPKSHRESTSGASVRKGSGKSVKDVDKRASNVYDIPEEGISRKASSHRELPPVPQSRCRCAASSRCIAIVLIVVMLIAVAAVIVGTLFALKTCKETFTKVKDTFAIGREKMKQLTTVMQCEVACREKPWCGGYEFERLRQTCFLVRGAVTEAQMLPAPTTDHFQRHGVCSSSDEEMTVCTMVYSHNGHALGGVDVGTKSLAECIQLCEEEGNCREVDYNKVSRHCFVHTQNNYVKPNACCHHYSKACQRCEYKVEKDRYTVASITEEQIHDLAHCGLLCNQKAECTGFDFEFNSNTCALAYINYTTQYLSHAHNYRKGACAVITDPS